MKKEKTDYLSLCNYGGVLYPEVLAGDQMLFFYHEDIVNVFKYCFIKGS